MSFISLILFLCSLVVFCSLFYFVCSYFIDKKHKEEMERIYKERDELRKLYPQYY
jgi:hypothetical protein